MKKNRPNQIVLRCIENEREEGNNISVRQVAIKAGLDYKRLNTSLKDENWNPTFDTMEKIGDALGYSITLRAEKRKNA